MVKKHKQADKPVQPNQQAQASGRYSPAEVTMAVRAALGTPEGKALMFILDKKFYDVDTIPTGAVDGAALSLIMAVNEGQRRVVKWLKHQLEKDITNDGSGAGSSNTGDDGWY